MSADALTWVESFVLPLLEGGTVEVGRPLRSRDHADMLGELGRATSGRLAFARLRRAQLLTADPDLPDPDADELALWIGLHNLLVFDHPDRARVWARSSTWRRVEGATRTLLSLPLPTTLGEGLARHVAVGALLELVRTDTIVGTPVGDIRFLGQDAPRRRLGLGATGSRREESVEWIGQPHAPETERLLADALRASPLTCLLRPLTAPPGWSPLWASGFLRDRAHARAVVHAWATQREWIRVGGAVLSALLPSLPAARTTAAAGVAAPASGPKALPGAVVPTSPRAVGAVVAALCHVHVLKVLELDTRLGVAVGARDVGVTAFLALPLVLPYLQSAIGSPFAGLQGTSGFAGAVQRRWTEYLDHLEGVVPRVAVENLLAALVPHVVQPS
jgi:hypothetical protein